MIVDLVINDEFNEPMHYMSLPLKLTNIHLFDNKLNIDMAADDSQKENEILSIDYTTNSGNVVLKLQMVYKPDEDYTYVTNLVVKMSLSKINKWFGT